MRIYALCFSCGVWLKSIIAMRDFETSSHIENEGTQTLLALNFQIAVDNCFQVLRLIADQEKLNFELELFSKLRCLPLLFESRC